MPRPVVTQLAEDLYARMAPVAGADESLGWPLLEYCGALAHTLDQVDELVRDTDVRPGWAIALDPDVAPAEALGWMAQFHGVRLLPGIDPELQRDRVKRADGFARGTVDAIRAEAQRHLTGTKRVDIIERQGSVYHVLVATYAPETPDQAAVAASLALAKPAGIIMTYENRAQGFSAPLKSPLTCDKP